MTSEASPGLPPVTFATRKFPPRVGGMEQLSADLAGLLAAAGPTELLAWDGRWSTLPAFGGRVLALAGRAGRPGAVPVLVLGDVALAVAVPGLASSGGRRVVVAHGLDVVWPPALYQRRVGPVLQRFDRVIANSEATRAVCLARGVDPSRCLVVPPPVRPPKVVADRGQLAAWLGRDLAARRVVLCLGRLVPRKGAAWFLEAVLPRLPEDVVAVVAGDGPERDVLPDLAHRAGVAERVVLPGAVTDAERALLYGSSDALVLPNRHVSGDMEGFGLVAVEAAMAGLPVVAAELEGLLDAVPGGPTTWRVASGDAAAFAAALLAALAVAPGVRAAERLAAIERHGFEALAPRWLAAVHD
ncbi:MAG: glycosyltransferase family 4 protein [Candidatus Sericytochromatia bacterium]|nr:glycosyltransferase family 4 protein [Candidatus Sericytochromatia bacterium]